MNDSPSNLPRRLPDSGRSVLMLLGALLLLAGAAPLAVRAYDDVVAWGGGLWPGAGEILLLLLGVAVVAAARLLPRARTGRDTR